MHLKVKIMRIIREITCLPLAGHTAAANGGGSVTSVVRVTTQVNGRRQSYTSHHTHTP